MPSALYVLTALAGILGLCVGSFLNVIIIRGARGEWPWGRSKCESCLKTLSPRDLVPIISFLLQKGRCRHCGTRLFVQYPLVEGSVALLYTASSWYLLSTFGLGIEAVAIILWTFLVIAAAITVFVADWKYYLIPNGPIALLTLLGVSSSALSDGRSISYDLLGAFLAAFFIFLLWLLSRGRVMGLGDAKLVFALSWVVGYPGSLAGLLFSFWAGAAAAGLLLLTKKKRLKDIMPFGPAIIIGFSVAYFFGEAFLKMMGWP